MTTHLTPKTETGIKRLAKELKSNSSMSHSKALDDAACQAGFENFRHAQRALSKGSEKPTQTGNPFIRPEGGLRKIGRQRMHGAGPYHDTPTIIVPHASVVDEIVRRALVSQPELSEDDLEAAITAATGSDRVDMAPRGFDRHRARPFDCHAFDIEIASRTGAGPEFWVQDILHELKGENLVGVGHPITVDKRKPVSNDMYHRAAKAALTISVNAALRRGLVDMNGGKHSWERPQGDGWTYFTEEWSGVPFLVRLRAQSFFEINIFCAFWTPEVTPEYINSFHGYDLAGRKFGELTASASIERLNGKYVCWSAGKDSPCFSGKDARIREMAAVSVEPQGYGI